MANSTLKEVIILCIIDLFSIFLYTGTQQTRLSRVWSLEQEDRAILSPSEPFFLSLALF